MKRVIALCLLCILCISFSVHAEDSMIPELSIYRMPVPESPAMAYLQSMGVGWNLGNTFDAFRDQGLTDELSLEGYWCGVKTTEAVFQSLKAEGFQTVRIPVSWHNHVSGEDFTISPAWLDRVQTVVDWALQCDLHVILNTHHDVDYAYYYPSSDYLDGSLHYMESIWSQLAERFQDYDDRLIFESMNEPRLKDTDHEWYFDPKDAACLDAAACINALNQRFVDTVRKSGGNNSDRYLMVPAYDAAPENACQDSFVLPSDTADNRLIVSVHAYTPYTFALDAGGTDTFSHTFISQAQQIPLFMNKLYRRYIQNNIPVVIGEFGARNKNGNLTSRVDFAAYYAACASARNMPCLWWDNHAFHGNGELFGMLDRKTATFVYPQIAEAMLTYGGYDKLSPAP